MPREKCQTRQLSDADVTSLCFDCQQRGKCLKQAAAEMAFRAGPKGRRNLFIVSDCEEYWPSGHPFPRPASIRPKLKAAGIEDLCTDCLPSDKGGCGLHADLGAINRIETRKGQSVGFAVICCSSALPAGDRLYEISDPAAAK